MDDIIRKHSEQLLAELLSTIKQEGSTAWREIIEVRLTMLALDITTMLAKKLEVVP